ncbi:MAG: hypothetical protein WBD27_17405 [Pyrinomonadaceae bacterium]|mgnify:CR=1 FL=1
MNDSDFELYKEEILELTELLNQEWIDLRNLIVSKGIVIDKTLLVNYYEDEEGGEYGVLVVDKKDAYKFEAADKKISLIKFDDLEIAKKECPQVEVAVAL